jgi:DNA-binding response OmpR family regulator
MKHVLVVEDENHLAFGIKYNLEAEGFLVTTVGDGPQGLKIFNENPSTVDLIILDLMLPGMSGYAVCQSIRQQGSEVPILMLSARTLTEDRIRGFDAGTDVYLQKPFELEELLSIVRNLTSRRRSSNGATTGNATNSAAERAAERTPDERSADAAEIYRFDNGRVEVNFDTYQVNVAGKSVRLTAMEMKLLRYFIEHEGSVVTRGELLENVWGMSHSPTTRTVDNFIVNLRKYFEHDPSRPQHFLSIRGAGYRFVATAELQAESEDRA